MSDREPPPRPLPEVLQVTAWEDYEAEKIGHEPRSLYVEAVYLPDLGPTATMLYRRLGTLAGEAVSTVHLPSEELSRSLGIGGSSSKWGKLNTALGRLVRFNLAEWQDDDYAVRRAAPTVTGKRLQKLPPSSRMMHDRIMRTHLPEELTLVRSERAS